MDMLETNLFGELLRQFRKRSRFTQERLAHEIGQPSRGNIQAWEGGQSLPREREIVLALARALRLTNSETDRFLLAAHHPQEYYTQGRSDSSAELREHLRLEDLYVDESDEIPVIDITLYNKGEQTFLPKRVQVEILDVGEFRFCDEEEEEVRTPIPCSDYDVMLSPESKGGHFTLKIAHLLRADEADRFQFRLNQDDAGWSLAYVWYYLKIVFLYNEPTHELETKPLLVSLPPVGTDIKDVWSSSSSLCSEQNRATLLRMSELEANRSGSVDDTIKQILGK